MESLKPPFVLKADGLAAGKGVVIVNDLEEAKNEFKSMLNGKFGSASETVIIEEFLNGIEFSLFVLTDGEQYVLLPEAKDYKRIGEGDIGLNTGGMGAVSPVPFFNGNLREKTIKEVVEPTIKGFKEQNLNYRGFVFFGLIACNDSPYLIEYNVRMGDPETEVVIPRLKESLSDLISAAQNKKLVTKTAEATKDFCTTVFSVAQGYPEAYKKGDSITISKTATNIPEILFHAGTKGSSDNDLVTNGGRIIAATCMASSMNAALDKSYNLINTGVDFSTKYFRKDIGQDLKSFLA